MTEGGILNVLLDPAGRPVIDIDSKEAEKSKKGATQVWRVAFGGFTPARVVSSGLAIDLTIRLTVRVSDPPSKPLARIKYGVMVTGPEELISMGPDYWAGRMLCLAANYAQSRICNETVVIAFIAVPFSTEEEDIVSAALDFAKEYDIIFAGVR